MSYFYPALTEDMRGLMSDSLRFFISCNKMSLSDVEARFLFNIARLLCDYQIEVELEVSE